MPSESSLISYDCDFAVRIKSVRGQIYDAGRLSNVGALNWARTFQRCITYFENICGQGILHKRSSSGGFGEGVATT